MRLRPRLPFLGELSVGIRHGMFDDELVIPFVILVAATLALRTIGAAGIVSLKSWTLCLRGGLFAMFLLTASAHWAKRRSDLIRMVPSAFPRPGIVVTTTGLLEILGAIGLLIPMTARAASICRRCC